MLLGKSLKVMVVVACMCVACVSAHAIEPADTASDNWIKQLIAYNFRINEPGIKYPKFARFLLKVYNWGDRTFNTYDTDYVVGTGKNWKAMCKSYNWFDSYSLFFSRDMRMNIMTDVYSDIGPTLCFMAVNYGYAWNANTWFGRNTGDRKTFNLNFGCALFAANLETSSAKGGARIKRFGDYRPNGRGLNMPFNDISQDTKHFDVYYFFNNRRYSQAAAYTYSKYQKRSAGSWIVGLGITSQKIYMDFSGLPDHMFEYLPSLYTKYDFHYVDYDLLGGYGYNVVMPHNWLYNITVLPSIGYKHSYNGTTDGRKDMLSTNIKGMMSFTYNHKALFTSLVLHYDGHLNLKPGYTFYNSMASASLIVGMRF